MQSSLKRGDRRAASFLGGLLLWIVCILPGNASADFSPPEYDPDSLVYMSTDIVEGRYVDGLVAITAVYSGGLHVGERIFVRGLYAYQKGMNPFMNGRPLSSSDRLVLFLVRNAATSSFDPVGSSVRIIWRGHVYGFDNFFSPSYMSSPAVSGDTNSSVAIFRQSIRDRLIKAQEWHGRFAKPVQESDIPWLLELVKQRAPTNTLWMFDSHDVIAAEAVRRLEGFHDLTLNEKTMVAGGYSWSMTQSFNSPEGSEYLFRRLSDSSVPHANRLALTQTMLFGWLLPTTRPSTDEHRDVINSLNRLAKLVKINATDEDVAVNLINAAGPTTQTARDFKDESAKVDYFAALQPLIDLYQQPSTSESLRYQIEVALSRFDEDIYSRLRSKSGPIPSIVSEGDAQNWNRTSGQIALSYAFSHISGRPPITGSELVFESIETGKQSTVNAAINWGTAVASGGGGTSFNVPPALAPGRYRIFLRFKNGSAVVSEGHYFETTLPQQLTVAAQVPWVMPWHNGPIPFPRALNLGLIGVAGMPLLPIGMLALKARRRRRRSRAGLCIQCGYDLRASSGRCPECAAPLPPRFDSSWWTRPLRRTVAIAALVAAIAAVGLWIRGYRAADCISLTTPDASGSIYSTRGNIVIERGGTISEDVLAYEHEIPSAFPRSAEEAGGENGLRFAGFQIVPDANLIVIPCWLVVVVTAALFVTLAHYGRARKANRMPALAIS